ncbi:MAG: hypothetical protein AABZ60_14955, partial [Planctomycetota bacterium]
MSFRRSLNFFIFSCFCLSGILAQEASETLLFEAKQKYKEAQQENERVLQDPSTTQRQKTIRSIRHALNVYSQIIEQYPEKEESVTEEM